MFGCLFDEDENAEVVYQPDRNVKTTEKESKIILTAPPPPRSYTNMCGIQNQGATCYLNSLLQTLLFTPEFRDGLFALSQEELGWVDASNDKQGDKKLRVIPVELQKLFSQLLLADVEAVSTTDLTESFGWVDNEELQQHDVQELNRILFSAIEKSLVGTSGMDLISRLYRGTVVNQVECLECGHVSEREEGFFDLTLSVSGHSSLESSLKSTFLIPEKMNGSNRYHCSCCDHLVDANKGTKLRHLPPVLTLSLLRFSYNPMKGERFKDTSKFSFPTRIDLSQFRDNSCCEEKENGSGLKNSNLYQLLSVVVHKGNAHGGHYHAYVRDVGCLGHWNLSSSQEEKTSKSCANREKESAVLSEKLVSESEIEVTENYDKDLSVPAALLRDILRHGNHIAPSGTMPLVDLCSKLSELTSGSSWRKTFQPEFGHLSRFLSLHPSLFYFNKIKRTVGLQPRGAKPLVPPRAHRESHGSGADGSSLKGAHRRKKRKKKKGKVCRRRKGERERRFCTATRQQGSKVDNYEEEEEEGGGEGDEESGDEESSSDNGEVVEGCNWFDFDDASVTAIPVSALEAQFSGRESAYMLFYRREGMGVGKGRKSTLVPEHLAKLVEEKNLRLKREREEYEKALHEIFIRVLPSSAYIFRNGGLQKRSGNENIEEIRVSADKRWTVDRLNMEVLKACKGVAGWEDEWKCFYMCQDTPCGLHLVEPLFPNETCSDGRLVEDVLKEENLRLFAWNGVEVGGVRYHAGPENEPLLLRILLPPVGGVSHEITCGFPKSSLLAHVRVKISKLCHLPLLSLHLLYEPPMEDVQPPSKYQLRRKAHRSQENSTRLGKVMSKDGDGDNENFTLVKPIRLSLMSNDLSLSTLGMESGGRIVANTKSLSGTSSPESSSNLVVWVEDWTETGMKVSTKMAPHSLNNSNGKNGTVAVVQWGTEGRVVRIEVPAEMTISQLKSIAIEQLELPSTNYRLRKQEDETVNCSHDAVLNRKIGLKCPLQEHLFLNEANIHSGSKLILEEGQPVGDKQIWLTYSLPPSIGDSPRDFEIVVEKKCPVRELLRNMLTLAHLSGEEWHVRKTKWNGDIGDPLDDLSATLCEESLVHGQHLNLCEKSLPHRGFIRLYLYLCSHPNGSNTLIQSPSRPVQSMIQNGRNDPELLQDESSENGNKTKLNNSSSRGKWLMQHLEEKQPCLEVTDHILDYLGCLEVDQELSLDQLKESLMALCPKISMLHLSSPKLLRLRLLQKVENASKVGANVFERMRFSRVLRNSWTYSSHKNLHPEKKSNQLTLSSLQLHSGSTIGVQILTAEEELGPHDVVLELCQYVPDHKDEYFPSVELIWNNSSNVAPEKSRTLCSSQPPHNFKNADTINNSFEVSDIPKKSNSIHSETLLLSIVPQQNSSCVTSEEEILPNETSPLLKFKKAVSSTLGLSHEKIVLAKYLSTKREWSVFQDVNVLQDGTSHHKSMPRPRKKGTAENCFSIKSTRHCLATLSDGDVIGVKDLMSLTEEEDAIDFSLNESEASVNNKIDNDENKKNKDICNEQGQSNKSKEGPLKKQEKGIHIRVVDYS